MLFFVLIVLKLCSDDLVQWQFKIDLLVGAYCSACVYPPRSFLENVIRTTSHSGLDALYTEQYTCHELVVSPSSARVNVSFEGMAAPLCYCLGEGIKSAIAVEFCVS